MVLKKQNWNYRNISFSLVFTNRFYHCWYHAGYSCAWRPSGHTCTVGRPSQLIDDSMGGEKNKNMFFLVHKTCFFSFLIGLSTTCDGWPTVSEGPPWFLHGKELTRSQHILINWELYASVDFFLKIFMKTSKFIFLIWFLMNQTIMTIKIKYKQHWTLNFQNTRI